MNQGVFSPSVLLRVLQTLSPCCLSIWLRTHILLQNCFVSFSSVVDMSSCVLLQLAGRIFFFHCFGMSCFVCIILSCLDIFLVFLLSPVPSDLFPRVVLLFLLGLLFFFSSQHVSRFFLCFIIFACCRRLLLLLLLLFHSFRIFLHRVWAGVLFNGVYVTAKLPRYPGLFFKLTIKLSSGSIVPLISSSFEDCSQRTNYN